MIGIGKGHIPVGGKREPEDGVCKRMNSGDEILGGSGGMTDPTAEDKGCLINKM